MACSGVAVEHTLAGHLVDRGFGSLEGFLGSSLVAGGDELAHLLDGGAVLAALGGEMQVARNRLTGALASLLGVSNFFELS